MCTHLYKKLIRVTQRQMCNNLANWNLMCFSQYITHPFFSTLALIAIPLPMASGIQTGKQGRVNRTELFIYKGKKLKTKFQLVKPGAQLSNVTHNLRVLLAKNIFKTKLGAKGRSVQKF